MHMVAKVETLVFMVHLVQAAKVQGVMAMPALLVTMATQVLLKMPSSKK